VFSSTGLAVTGKITTTSTANDWTNIVIGNTTSGQSYGTRIQAGTTAADYSFLVKNATNATEYFSILGNGAAAFGNNLAVTGTLSATSNIYTSARYFAQRQSGSLSFAIGGYTNGSAATVLTGAIGDIVAFGNVGGDGVIFANSNTERMRLTDTGLGIGTSSPGTKLEVNGNVLKIYDQSTANANLVIRNTTTGDALGFTLQQDGVNSLFYNSSNGYMAFATNATERMRLDSSGTFRVKGAGTAGSTDAFQVAGTAPASAMVLNSSGNLYLGAISSALANEKIGRAHV
jgi:hypothetical protein